MTVITSGDYSLYFFCENSSELFVVNSIRLVRSLEYLQSVTWSFLDQVLDEPGDQGDFLIEAIDYHSAPRALLVADGQAEYLDVSGDGLAVREYVHVSDLAAAYAAALEVADPAGHRIYNVGSGVGVSVREVIETTERITGRPVPVRWGQPVSEPRELRADNSRIRTELGWQPSRSSMETIVADAWRAITC